jgi:hypothetical protein
MNAGRSRQDRAQGLAAFAESHSKTPQFSFVIASEAKQSRAKKEDWIASSLRSSQ